MNQPSPATASAFEMFLSRGWGCLKAKNQAGHLVALANPANCPMTDTSPNALYGFAFHSHATGTTTALLPSHEPVEPETDFTSSPHHSSLSAVPYGWSLPCPQGQRRRGTSPVWMFRHSLPVTARITRIVREDNRIQTPRESHWKLRNLLRRRGGSSQDHSGQNAPPLSNAGRPLRYAPLLERTGYAPPEPDCPRSFANVFCTNTAHTGRIKSVLAAQTAPFMLRLSNTSIRLTHPGGNVDYVSGSDFDLLPSPNRGSPGLSGPFGLGLNQFSSQNQARLSLLDHVKIGPVMHCWSCTRLSIYH